MALCGNAVTCAVCALSLNIVDLLLLFLRLCLYFKSVAYYCEVLILNYQCKTLFNCLFGLFLADASRLTSASG